MITMLLFKIVGLAEFFLDYIVQANFAVAQPGIGTGYQWQLINLQIAPTAKGWAILADIWTLIHNTLDMLAQFSTSFPVNEVTGTTTLGGTALMYNH